MKTNEFIALLGDHKSRELLFEYSDGRLVGANYHITEVKHVSVESVDCGARSDAWKETVIQLWESPAEAGKTNYMTAYKALGILSKVARLKPLSEDAEVRFEYGNRHFHTAQLYVKGVETRNDRLLVRLDVAAVACKANDVCGIPAGDTIPVVEGCSPGSGCC
jgi:hypothetical protein